VNAIFPLLALALGGCGVGREPDPARADRGAATPGPDFASAAFSCCAHDGVRAAILAYTEVQEALARDDAADALAGLPLLQRQAQAAAGDPALPAGVAALVRALGELAATPARSDLDGLRAAFPALSEKAVVLAQADRGGSKKLAVAFCPQSNAIWLQASPQVQNPYLGALGAGSGAFRP